MVLSLCVVVAGAAESDMRFRLRSLDITVTPSRTLKIGETANDPDVTWSVDFATGANSTKLTYLPEMTYINLKGDRDNHFRLSTSNSLDIKLCFECYVGNDAHFNPMEKFSFTLN